MTDRCPHDYGRMPDGSFSECHMCCKARVAELEAAAKNVLKHGAIDEECPHVAALARLVPLDSVSVLEVPYRPCTIHGGYDPSLKQCPGCLDAKLVDAPRPSDARPMTWVERAAWNESVERASAEEPRAKDASPDPYRRPAPMPAPEPDPLVPTEPVDLPEQRTNEAVGCEVCDQTRAGRLSGCIIHDVYPEEPRTDSAVRRLRCAGCGHFENEVAGTTCKHYGAVTEVAPNVYGGGHYWFPVDEHGIAVKPSSQEIPETAAMRINRAERDLSAVRAALCEALGAWDRLDVSGRDRARIDSLSPLVGLRTEPPRAGCGCVCTNCLATKNATHAVCAYRCALTSRTTYHGDHAEALARAHAEGYEEGKMAAARTETPNRCRGCKGILTQATHCNDCAPVTGSGGT